MILHLKCKRGHLAHLFTRYLCLLPPPESIWVETCCSPSPAPFSCRFLSVNDVVVVMLSFILLKAALLCKSVLLYLQTAFCCIVPISILLDSLSERHVSSLLKLCSRLWIVMQMGRADAGRVQHGFLPYFHSFSVPVPHPDSHPCTLLMVNQFFWWGNQGLLSFFPDEVTGQDPYPFIPVSTSKFWAEREDSAGMRWRLASSPVNPPSVKRRLSKNWSFTSSSGWNLSDNTAGGSPTGNILLFCLLEAGTN